MRRGDHLLCRLHPPDHRIKALAGGGHRVFRALSDMAERHGERVKGCFAHRPLPAILCLVPESAERGRLREADLPEPVFGRVFDLLYPQGGVLHRAAGDHRGCHPPAQALFQKGGGLPAGHGDRLLCADRPDLSVSERQSGAKGRKLQHAVSASRLLL